MPEPKDTDLVRRNRVLIGVCFMALVLLGPSFMVGYFTGYRSAQASGPGSGSMPPVVASTQNEPPAGSGHQKAAGQAKTKTRASVANADQAAPGQIYLQLAAGPQSNSAVIIDALRNNGLPAVATEVPEKPGLYRVLVGPLLQGELDKTRAELRSRGFDGDSAIKKIF